MMKRSIIIIGLIVLLAIGIFSVSSILKKQMTEQNQDGPYVPAVGVYQVDKCKSMLQEAKDKYETGASQNEVSREPLDPINDITEPRYKKTDEGFYDNAQAEDSGEAVLMFTGDIMCRYEQQELNM